MTLIARLCALCAVCALMQTAFAQTEGQDALRMIGGLLMLHLVIAGAQEMAAALSQERELMGILTILMQ